MSHKIKINHLTGDEDKHKLKGCYFLPAVGNEGYYNFFDKCNGGLALNVSNGNNFSFMLDTYTWNVTNFVISGTATDGMASGNWSNNDTSDTIKDNGDGESGTFSAQTGTPEDADEAASSATA